MRVVRLADVPVVVRIRRRDEVTVVVPSNTPADDVLTLARLVLSRDELTELETAIGHRPAPVHHH